MEGAEHPDSWVLMEEGSRSLEPLVLGEEVVGAGFLGLGGKCWILGLYITLAQALFPKPSPVLFSRHYPRDDSRLST